MILENSAELAGRVKLQISGGKRGTIDYPWQDNMILDQGIHKLLSSGGSVSNMAFLCFGVGSSSEPVSANQTGLIAPIALYPPAYAYTNTFHGWNSEGGFGWSRKTISFPRGHAAGNISELTTSNDYNYSSALARALVRDSEGNPTTITVLSDEVLSITWEFRKWWTVKDNHDLVFDVDGVPVTTRVIYKSIEQLSKSNNGLGNGGVSGFRGALVSSNTAEVSTFYAENAGNPAISNAYAGLNHEGVLFPSGGDFASFDPPIPKTNSFTCRVFSRLTLTRRNQ